MANEIFPNSSRSPSNVGLGQPVSLTWAATATLGIAYREGTITKPNGVVVPLARVWYPDGPLGVQAFTDTSIAGTYTWLSRYADMSVINAQANGLTAQYYNDANLGTLVFTRTDPNVDYDFPENTAPSPGIVTNHYSMRWSGKIIPRFSELYTFSTLSDDGVRLYVNGVQLVNNWTDHGSTTDSGTIALTANVPVTIVLEYFNNNGPGVIHLYWSSFSQNYQVVPQTQLRNNGSGTLTYGTGYKDQSLQFTVGGIPQSSVAVSPTSTSVAIGTTVNFTASGGSGTGQYNWGGEASGIGNSKSVQFNAIGTFQVTVYRAGDGTYSQSNTATATITVVKANQALIVASPAAQTVPVGTLVTITANGGSGTGQYVWSGDYSATTSANFIQFVIGAAGTLTISVQKLGDASFNASNSVIAKVVGQKSAQATVSVSPTPINVEPGTSVLFTASGGSGSGDYQWGGDASGVGATKSVVFNTLGNRTVTVKKLSDAAYLDSNTATAAVTVQVHVITPASSFTPSTRPVGVGFTLTWNASATIGLAYREGTILQPDGNNISLARVNYFEPGMLGPQAFLPNAGKGTYKWTSRYADKSIINGPPYTYGVGYVEQFLNLIVTGIVQTTVTISPVSQSVVLGTIVHFTANGGSGTGNYQWGGDAAGSGSTQDVVFNTLGSRTVTVKKLGDSSYADSNTATATITVTKLPQTTVAISPVSGNVVPGTMIEFEATGGDGSGDYQWGGEASGTGLTKQVTFSVVGTKFVTVKKLGDGSYLDSNTATATIVVATNIITPKSTVTPSSAAYGALVTLKWNATATLGIAWREGEITKPDGSVITLPRVLANQVGMLGPQSFTDTAQRGTYQWRSRYADASIDTGPPYTYGTGYIDQTINFVIAGLAQSAVSISPTPVTVLVTNSLNLTASGGSGTGIFRWTLVNHTINVTTVVDTFGPELEVPNIVLGHYTVTAKRLGDFNYNDSSNSNTATVDVIKNPQSTVTIAPTAQSIEVGNSIDFSAIGGNGTGDYHWVGSAVIGPARTVQFNTVGTFNVSVFKASDGVYLQSNTATAIIVVTPIGAPSVAINATPQDGQVPLTTLIAWSSDRADSVTVSGPGLSSNLLSGTAIIPNLLAGLYIYTIKATNAGGTSTAVTQVSVDTTPVDNVGFTVRFTDQTVLRADTWLWDFGDGSSTTTVRNPIHTYAEVGTYLVTLTVTCDGKTDVKTKLITIACSLDDPLPFTPDWNTLVNEEDYPPFDDPRYVGTDFTSPLAPVASRQSGAANPNWIICPTIDYYDGPDDLDVPQESRFNRRWVVRLTGGKVFFGVVGLPLIAAPADMFPFNLNLSSASYITGSFGSLSQPFFAYQNGVDKVVIRYRIGPTPINLQFDGESPRLFSELIINPITELCDVICFYTHNGNVCVRMQRDHFLTEYVVATPSIYGSELAVFTKVDANRAEQRIYLYGKTIGGKRLLFRSGLYPSFPDSTPIVVVTPPEAGTLNITLDSTSYGRIDLLDFTDVAITLESIVHDDGQNGKATMDSGIEDGSYDTIMAEKATYAKTFVDGTYAPYAEKGTYVSTWENGTHGLQRTFVFNDVTIEDGTHGRGPSADNGSVYPTLEGGNIGIFGDHGSHFVTLDNGTVANFFDKGTIVNTLDFLIHKTGSESAFNAITVSRVFHSKGSEGISLAITLDSLIHKTGTEFIRERLTLDSTTHAIGQHKASNRLTVAVINHKTGQEKILIASTLGSGTMLKSDAGYGINSLSIENGEHKFGILTFDNTDDDHWDSTKFDFSWDQSFLDPDIA